MIKFSWTISALLMMLVFGVLAHGGAIVTSINPGPGQLDDTGAVRITTTFMCDFFGANCEGGTNEFYVKGLIHNGLDIHNKDFLNNNTDFENRVVSMLPGQITSYESSCIVDGVCLSDAGNNVRIQHLLSTGYRRLSRYLHMNEIQSDVAIGNWAPSDFFLGYTSDTTSGDLYPHLHVDVLKSDSRPELAECAEHWQPPCVDGKREGYSATGSTIVDNPIDYVKGLVKVLFPFLDATHNASPVEQEIDFPGEDIYDVFIVANRKVNGSLNVSSQFRSDDDYIGRAILVEKTDDRSKAKGGACSDPKLECSYLDGSIMLASSTEPLFELPARHLFKEGDYLFMASVELQTSSLRGYPLLIKAEKNPRSRVVDNDMSNVLELPDDEKPYVFDRQYFTGKYEDNLGDDSNKRFSVPGYFYSATLVDAAIKPKAIWRPGRTGRYGIEVHVPDSKHIKPETLSGLSFDIITQGEDAVSTEKLQPSEKRHGWRKLKTDVCMTSANYVSLDLGSSENETVEGWVPFDAVRFYAATHYIEEGTKKEIDKLDIVLVIDSSGSMLRSDPKNNRVVASNLMVDLLEAGDNVGVVDFDFDAISMSQILGDQSLGDMVDAAEHRDTIKNALAQIDASGGTNIEAALAKAVSILEAHARKDAHQLIILLTDGQGLQTGQIAAQQLAGRCWPVVAVGLGDGVEEQNLKTIAKATGGQYFGISVEAAAKTALAEAFKETLDSVKLIDKLIFEGEFIVQQGSTEFANFSIADSSIKELTITRLIPGSDVITTIQIPDGRIITRENAAAHGIYHALGETYEIFKISSPPIGEWQVAMFGADTDPEGEFTILTVTAEFADSDSDGVKDHIDNCPDTPNQDQNDQNGNGVGDACDAISILVGDFDFDGDVDRDDLVFILSARREPVVSPDDMRDMDGDGLITASDARQLVLMCTRPRCATE